jgi:hypothetical protein
MPGFDWTFQKRSDQSEKKVAEQATFFRFPKCIGTAMAGFGSDIDWNHCAGVPALVGLDARSILDPSNLSFASAGSELPFVPENPTSADPALPMGFFGPMGFSGLFRPNESCFE